MPLAGTAAGSRPTVDTWLAQRRDAIDEELAKVLLKRPDPPTVEPMLELQIDLLLLDRRMAQQAQNTTDPDVRPAMILREMQIAQAITDLEAFLTQTAPCRTPNSSPPCAIHALTYTIAKAEARMTTDEMGNDIGIA